MILYRNERKEEECSSEWPSVSWTCALSSVAVIRRDKDGNLSIDRHAYKIARCYNTMRCLRLKQYLIYEEEEEG